MSLAKRQFIISYLSLCAFFMSISPLALVCFWCFLLDVALSLYVRCGWVGFRFWGIEALEPTWQQFNICVRPSRAHGLVPESSVHRPSSIRRLYCYAAFPPSGVLLGRLSLLASYACCFGPSSIRSTLGPLRLLALLCFVAAAVCGVFGGD